MLMPRCSGTVLTLDRSARTHGRYSALVSHSDHYNKRRPVFLRLPLEKLTLEHDPFPLAPDQSHPVWIWRPDIFLAAKGNWLIHHDQGLRQASLRFYAGQPPCQRRKHDAVSDVILGRTLHCCRGLTSHRPGCRLGRVPVPVTHCKPSLEHRSHQTSRRGFTVPLGVCTLPVTRKPPADTPELAKPKSKTSCFPVCCTASRRIGVKC